jgi:cyclopropane fatty-acyl-phospholipid synthase-like methyltransferase
VTDPKRIVQEGYDAMADRYGEWRAATEGSPNDEWVAELLANLPDRTDVLELGCGHGLEARTIVDAGHRYVGVDISAEQLRRAKELVPEADLRHADLTEIDFPDGSFDAVLSLYVFGHLPRAELPALLERMAGWLRRGGRLLATFGRSGWEGVEDDFIGVPMFFGSYTDEDTLALLESAGFVVERAEVVPIVEPDGDASFLWVLAARGRAARTS